jgi:hypothetical protein
MDLRKVCGNSSSGSADATMITAENVIVRPDVIIVRRRAASVSYPSAISSRNRLTM